MSRAMAVRDGVQLAPAAADSLNPAAPAILRSLERLGGPVVHAHTLHVLTEALPLIAEHPSLPARTAERALVLAGPDDVVCLPARPDPDFIALLGRLELGPDPARIVVPQGAPTAPLNERLTADPAAIRRVADLLPQRADTWLSPLLGSLADATLAATLGAHRRGAVRTLVGDSQLVARVNLKHVVRAAAISLGVPVAAGCAVELELGEDGRLRDLAPLHAAIRHYARRTGRAIVRGDVGIGGSSVFVMTADGGPPEELARLTASPAQRIFLVEECLEVLASPNVQVFIDPIDGSAVCVGVSDQLLSAGLGHRGNVYPSRAKTAAEMVAGSLTLARWLAREGYRGFLGFDLVEYADAAGQPRWVLAELNPRFNGASQPVVMLERLNRAARAAGRPEILAFAAGVVPTPACTFAELERRLGQRLFDPATGRGVLPFHTAGLRDGSCGLAVFGASRDDVEQELAALAETPRSGDAA